MYKKIKNGSFMNWIWFIICLLPLLLITIYSGLYLNNNRDTQYITIENIEGNTNKTILNYGTSDQEYITLNNMLQYVMLTTNANNINENGSFKTNENGHLNITFNFNYQQMIEDNKKFYMQLIFENSIPFIDYDNVTLNSPLLLSIRKNYNSTISWEYIDLYAPLKNITNAVNIYDNKNMVYYDLENIINIALTNIEYDVIYNFNIDVKINNSLNNNLYAFITEEQTDFDIDFIQNYNNYVNDYNEIKFNSTPISYNYNNETYLLPINNISNYFATNETLNINENYKYNNSIPTLNYNNYNNYKYDTRKNNNDNEPYNENIQYYRKRNGYQAVVNGNTTNGIFTFVPTTPSQANINNWNTSTQKSLWSNKGYKAPIESTINVSETFTQEYTMNQYLSEMNNTLKSNGFISNAFLNFSQLFNVQNYYYSLACYYIEYLLVIVLLHLAFDVLYMLPNICHKFMEKLGGERD